MDHNGIQKTLLRLLLLAFVSISSFTWTTHAQCDCGYLIKNDRYTHAIVTNFARILDIEDISDGSGNELKDWEVQEWSTNFTERSDAIFVKQNDPTNVWIQDGLLHLRQRAFSEQDDEDENPVSIAEIVTRRDNILYGSFRAKFAIKVEDDTDGGSVAGFFFYHGDASEIDIEILTKELQTDDTNTEVHYSQQPTYNYDTDEFYEDASLTQELKVPWTEQQEHRWDWHPDVTYFYQDGQQVAELRKNVPQRKGKIMINLWADGGEWSGYPADKDVIMQIQYIELYFNTSMSHNGADPEYLAACEAAGGLGVENATCVVEKPDHTPEPSSAVRLQSWRSLSWAVSGLVLYFALHF